jgi:hypothetical protein
MYMAKANFDTKYDEVEELNYVFVNGALDFENGKFMAVLAGKVLLYI